MPRGRHCGGRRRRGGGHHGGHGGRWGGGGGGWGGHRGRRPRPSRYRRPTLFWINGKPYYYWTDCSSGNEVNNYGNTTNLDSESDSSGNEDEGQGGGGQGGQGEGQDPGPAEKDDLLVESVDFQVVENALKHHTDEFDITEDPKPQLVVRRGQQFTIQVVFSRAYNTKKDDLRLLFQIGDNPKPSKGTRVEFVLSDKDEEGEWGAKVTQQAGKTLTLAVFTPPTCIVGKWRLRVNVVKKTDTKTTVFSYIHRDPIYVLFNPWCKADAVYMDSAKYLEAYVMKENGKLYVGNYTRWSARPWVYGQFTGKVLDCCMYLLNESDLGWGVRGDPVHVVRKLTAMVNVQDEGGVLTGNWSGNYSGGKSPLSWTGSAPILEQYYREKRAVKYGQCWVFSGVLTTVCRALGIPARSITNFESAHDSDTSVTIDYHYDKHGRPLKDQDEDSVWNFHVWNEAWMARPDLPTGYGGWQACDATPQETSDGEYCCGPCPVVAIKEGQVTVPYDGPFIFAEVNADKINWVRQSDGSWEKSYVNKTAIGKLISTLGLEGDRREDVTLQYKYPEGSAQERAAVKKATGKDDRAAAAGVPQPRGRAMPLKVEDVDFEVSFDAENTFVGSDFKMNLIMKNKSGQMRTVEGLCEISTMFYTGVEADHLTAKPIQDLKIKPGESQTVSVSVSADSYQEKLKDCCMLSLSIMTLVKETQQMFCNKDNARLRKPHLSIKGPASSQKGQQVDVEVSFLNPFNRTLTDCSLEVEGPGIRGAKNHPQGDVKAKSTFTTTLKVKPVKKGKREIVVIFNCRELEDVNGTHVMTIHK